MKKYILLLLLIPTVVFGADTGDIPSNIAIGASQDVRRNSGNSAFEAYTPATTSYADAKVADAINDSTTTVAPSQNAVFDALALKAPSASPTFTGTVTLPVATQYVHVSVSSGVTTTGANTTPVNVSGAVFTYVNNAVYRIKVMGRINSTAATTGVGIQFDVSTAITSIDVMTMHPLTTTTTNVTYSIADDTTIAPTTGVPAGPLDVPFVTDAIFRPGNNTGTCQLRFRSETTAVTELLAGVVMVVERLQ